MGQTDRGDLNLTLHGIKFTPNPGPLALNSHSVPFAYILFYPYTHFLFLPIPPINHLAIFPKGVLAITLSTSKRTCSMTTIHQLI
jgi:hypothetical protein